MLKGIQDSRVRRPPKPVAPPSPKCVVLWVQGAVRSFCNQALEYAIHESNVAKIPLIACFGLTEHYPEANARHYTFLLQGLKDLRTRLDQRNIPFEAFVSPGEPWLVPRHIAIECEALEVVTDLGYLNHQRAWREKLAQDLEAPKGKKSAGIPVVQVETESAVPVEIVSQRSEPAARTIRPKIHAHMMQYMKEPALGSVEMGDAARSLMESVVKRCKSSAEDGMKSQKDKAVLTIRRLDLSRKVEDLLDELNVDKSVMASPHQPLGGESAALKRLRQFCDKILKKYDEKRNDVNGDVSSRMSPYLHYGHISPITCCLAVLGRPYNGLGGSLDEKPVGARKASVDAFIEELVIRRELSFNHVWYHRFDYHLLDCVPKWAHETMQKHAGDEREHLYSLAELENSRTHDECWNASQKDLVVTGRMPNYMRMYWGKKIIEWSPTYKEAWTNLLYLNNKYFVDGRDANSFCNIAWIFGAKDRPWFDRPIFGVLRYYAETSLKKKFDMVTYVQYVKSLSAGRKGLTQGGQQSTLSFAPQPKETSPPERASQPEGTSPVKISGSPESKDEDAGLTGDEEVGPKAKRNLKWKR